MYSQFSPILSLFRLRFPAFISWPAAKRVEPPSRSVAPGPPDTHGPRVPCSLPLQKMPRALITGTPAAGKTTVAKALLAALNGRPGTERYEYVNVSEEVVSQNLYESYDEEFKSYVPDDRKLRRYLKGRAQRARVIFDHHTPYVLKGLGIAVCGVVRAPTEVLYDRMQERGYPERKVRENVEAEIMQVCLDEAREAFGDDRVKECMSTDEASLSSAVKLLLEEIEKEEREEQDGSGAVPGESDGESTSSSSSSDTASGEEDSDGSFSAALGSNRSDSDASLVGEFSDVKTESSSESSGRARKQKL